MAEVLISNWLDIIQLGRDGTNLLKKLSEQIEEISDTNAFYLLPIHLASQIITCAGEISFELAVKIIDGFAHRIGKDAILLLNCLSVHFDGGNNVASLLKHFVEFPMLEHISSYDAKRPKEEDDEDGIPDVDYEVEYHRLEAKVKELEMKLSHKIKIIPKEPKVEPNKFANSKFPKNIRLSVQECIDNNDVDALVYLINKDKNKLQEKVRDKNRVEQSGFCAAVVNGQTELAVAFVELGADPFEKAEYKRNSSYSSYRDEFDEEEAFSYARDNNPELALALCKTGKTRISPIKFAVERLKRLDFVKELVEKDGVNPTDGLENIYCSTPEIAEYLFASGADPNGVSSNSVPYIFYAGDKIGIFLEHGADPNITDPDGKTPIFQYFSNPKAVEMLINSGADVNVKTKDGQPLLLYHHLFSKDYDSIELVLKHGVDPNATFNGETALNKLIKDSYNLDNDFPVIKLLIEYGTIPDKTSFDLVREKDYTEATTKDIINELFKYALGK